MLTEARCAVSRIPDNRWSLDRFGHPRAQERGKSYTWAAGVLDDIWSFDPGVFGISPREAEQMDPQQRLLLELTWEALEDAGLRPSPSPAPNIGVFVGASSLDYGNLRILDASSGDAYAATGNTLSILSNRISYIFDLKGPSFTVDTACSSSLVALDAAVAAIESRPGRHGRRRRREPAREPLQLHLLLERADALAHGPVPGLLVERGRLRALPRAASCSCCNRPRPPGAGTAPCAASSRRAASTRMAAPPASRCPPAMRRARCSRRSIDEAEIDLDAVVFVEAHGTGTPVGDPIEAGAIGGRLGRPRRAPLPIGSIKTNIGHTGAGLGSRRPAQGEPRPRARSRPGLAAFRRAQPRDPLRRAQPPRASGSRWRWSAARASASPA